MKPTHFTLISTGLSHEANQHKMRILTFMSMGETQKEISFDTIEKELEIPPEEVESFIIECKLFFISR